MIPLTAEVFEQQYAQRSGTTVSELRALGRVVRPCHCGEEGCEGWMSIDRTLAAESEVAKAVEIIEALFLKARDEKGGYPTHELRPAAKFLHNHGRFV